MPAGAAGTPSTHAPSGASGKPWSRGFAQYRTMVSVALLGVRMELAKVFVDTFIRIREFFSYPHGALRAKTNATECLRRSDYRARAPNNRP